MSEMKEWIFNCPNCKNDNNCMTNLSKRTALDKATVKRINTSVSCGFCDVITEILDLENKFDIEFDWQPK